jgi:uncharacterized protein (TIGR03435 family)
MKQRPYSGTAFVRMWMPAALVILAASTPGVVGLAAAQTNTTPQFEVAALKVQNGPGRLSISPQRSGGRITWNAPLQSLLSYAYRIPMQQVTGKYEMYFYELAAKTDPSASDDEVRLMLRALLNERLKLVFHRETKEATGYALVIDKGGPKLKTANSQGELPPMPEFVQRPPQSFEGGILDEVVAGAFAIVGRGVSISQLAERLSVSLRTFVVDRTGLTGKYYFGFKYQPVFVPDDSVKEFEDAPSLFSVLPSELGLRLEKQKGTIEVLVVDHLEAPAAN